MSNTVVIKDSGQRDQEITRRRQPQQERAKDSIERILDAAAALLVEEGLQAFNTNAVADRAGVNIGTLYRYYGDKNAILIDLYARHGSEIQAWLDAMADHLAQAESVGAWAESLVSGYLELRQRWPERSMIRRVCHLVPELSQAERLVDDAVARSLGEGIHRRFAGLSEERCRLAAFAIMATVENIADVSLLNEGDDLGQTLEEVPVVIMSYLNALNPEAA